MTKFLVTLKKAPEFAHKNTKFYLTEHVNLTTEDETIRFTVNNDQIVEIVEIMR